MSDRIYIHSTGIVSALGAQTGGGQMGDSQTGGGQGAAGERQPMPAGERQLTPAGERQLMPAGDRLRAVEPDYAKVIDPKMLRRMSRIIRMGVAAAMECLAGATPDAIVTGTAYGCLEDTTVFLDRMVVNNEEMLTPTAFIQSTHNTVGAQIALILGCHGYNNTFVHRGFSFEHALLDGMMLINEGDAGTVLVGGVDEITDGSHAILSRLGLYKHGRINGEGAAFFLLSREPGGPGGASSGAGGERSGTPGGSGSAAGVVCLEGIDTFYKPADPAAHIRAFLERHPGQIDAVIGDTGEPFREKSGDYPTASAVGLWLAVEKVRAGAGRVLVYNNYLNIHHSLLLVSAC